MAVSIVSLSFSRAAQPEAQGPSSLLDNGFLYCILSHLISNFTGPQLNRGPQGPLLAWLGFPYRISSLTPTLWLLVLTELYNSSTPTQSPSQSWEWHVWSSSTGNNCHAVHRSLSSGASLCSGTVGPSPCPVLSAELTCAISFDKWPLRWVTSTIFEWYVCPGRRSKYNTLWKCKQYRRGFEFKSSSPFPKAVIITPRTPLLWWDKRRNYVIPLCCYQWRFSFSLQVSSF